MTGMFKRSLCTYLTVLGLMMVAAFHLSAQRARIIRVPQDRSTIQHAIDAVRAGDTVLVDHGLYYENLRINKNIVLASRYVLDHDTSHISRTIIDGSKPHDSLKASCIYISGKTDTNCIILGFTIRRGTGTYVHYSLEPGLSLNDPGVSQHWIAGGGIFANHSGARITYNIITDNRVATRIHKNFSFGAAIAAQESTFGKHLPSPIIIEYNTIYNNLSTGEFSEGAGIDLVQPAIIRYNTITDNRTVSKTRSVGGAVVIGMSGNYDIVVDGNYICRNVSGIGGGMLITSGFARRGRAIVINNIIADNEAFEVGGGANIVEGTYAIFVNNTIVGNRAMASGGGINVTYNAHATLINNIIWGNKAEQVSMWGDVQAITNAIEGGYPGRNNLRDDPKFLPDDSLLRLSPNSPCIGTGTDNIRIFQNLFPIPDHDLLGHRRPVPEGTSHDIGAIESAFDLPSVSTRIIKGRASSIDSKLKLTMVIEQITLADRDSATSEIVRAGRMNSTLIVNDTIRSPIHDSLPLHSYILPPGDNLIELEVIGRAMKKPKGINIFCWLEGSDPHVSLVQKDHAIVYHYYSELKPGTYKLIFQPQDQEEIIGYTNRVSIEIIVLPYWYQRWWAYVLYGVGVLGVAALFFQVRARRARLEHALELKRVEAEKLSELDRLKSRFFANLSHEFRTPLSLILGPADQLETSEPVPGRKEQLGLIRRNAERLLRMVNMLLQFARIESGTLKLNVSLQPIPQLLRRIVSSFSTAALKKGTALHIEIEPENFAGYVDSEKVEHVLENLLSNALKYTSTGGRVDVRARREGTELMLQVSDTGIGIPPEHFSHIFERFYRVDASHQYEGTGIGLSLAKELVEMHHGTIGLKSSVGVGTVASVRLPLSGYREHELVAKTRPAGEERSSVPEQVRMSQEIPETENGDKTVVLVAEDNDDAREYLSSRLTPEFDVVEAVNGAQAWDFACQRIPDVVVSDVMMPELSGYELCARLKQDERTSHIPVILLTALGDRTDKIEGLQTGADDYLVLTEKVDLS